MSLSVLTAYATLDHAIDRKSGVPLNTTVGALSALLFTHATCFVRASSVASMACAVPGTEASTCDRGWPTGIFWKSRGRSFVANDHGPLKSGATNQRPA